jgi:hypothetical protein
MNALVRTRHHVHNSLLALSMVCVVSGACLLAARPVPASIPDIAGAELAAEAALAACKEGKITADVEDGTSASREPRPRGRRTRQPLAMPYFSFAARS